ncbi:MAG: hypothetical protein GWM92_01645 [Gemmatimonadetes bacterium]|nr:hypothetical protein [Gemmatimonadota bacterium]NIR77183.1 hypothetical protein [Gemmatimonadota bacterium]NIT85699.1 hypothetical protein [Gemmatimonadota bacterium]NIU29529.1 hypothetical protein [Gemmatimonadota bacterium]NIU34576.1 hypothetical protein [Gemmatimonadota bacterium]
MSLIRRFVPGVVRRFLGGLRFPQLFLITAILFAVNLAVPDAIPFVDEILLALGSLLLGSLRKKEGPGEIEGTDVAGHLGGDEPDDP